MHPLHTRKARSCRNQVPQPSWSLSAEPDILRAPHDASSAIATRAHPERVAAVMRDGDWLGSPLGYLYQLVAAAGWTSLPFLPAISQPTLIVAGDDDPIIPLANARLMNLLIPRSQLHVYHGGHLGLATEAAELAPVVDAFLAAP
jgi:pimeloyl-ACP methyl ester carboxylesterase